MTLKQIKVHGSCFGFEQHTGFGNRFQSFAMGNVMVNDDRNGVEDVRHWHIYPEKQLLFLNAVLHTPHISVLHIYFF